MKMPGRNTRFAIGLGLGVIIGVATHKIVLWLPIGVVWGFLMSGAFGGGAKDDVEKEKK